MTCYRSRYYRGYAAALCLVLLTMPSPAAAQTVFDVRGNVEHPPNLVHGTELQIGSEIRVGSNGLVTIFESWSIADSDYQCHSWVLLSNTTYRVRSQRTAGQCREKMDGSMLDRARSGGPFIEQVVSRVMLITDGKADDFSYPIHVMRLLQETSATVEQRWQTGPGGTTPRTYPITCRGGASLNVTYIGALNEVYIRFARGSGPASSGLRSGECSWHDRAVHRDEPAQLCHVVNRVNISWQPNGRVQVNSGEAPYLRALGDRRRTFQFQVYNDPTSNPRCLRVTAGPS